MGLFEEILSDERAKELSRVESARTVVFPGHKGSQHDTWKGIKQMAEDLNRNGESVAFLPELDRVTSADALVLFRGRPTVADFKYCITTKANTLAEFPDNWQRFSASASLEQFVELANAVSNARKQLQFSTNFQAVVEKLLFVFIGEGNKWQQ